MSSIIPTNGVAKSGLARIDARGKLTDDLMSPTLCPVYVEVPNSSQDLKRHILDVHLIYCPHPACMA